MKTHFELQFKELSAPFWMTFNNYGGPVKFETVEEAAEEIDSDVRLQWRIVQVQTTREVVVFDAERI